MHTSIFIKLSLVAALSGCALPVLATNDTDLDEIGVEELASSLNGDRVTLSFVLNLNDIELSRQGMVRLVPELRHNGGAECVELPSTIVSGKTRAAVLERQQVLGNTEEAQGEVSVYRKGTEQRLPYTATLPFEEWMKDASLYVVAYESGCPGCKVNETELKVADQFYTNTIPDFHLSYVVPAVEPVKARKDSYSASVAFPVDVNQIRPEFEGNKAILDDVDSKVVAVLKNTDLHASKIEIVGYASPEASVNYNKDLAEKRATAFADFLSGRYGVSRKDFTSRGFGEDWKRAEELISSGEGTLTDDARQKVLEVIRTVSNLDARDAAIQAIDGGKSYQVLLKEVWPMIRRTEYTINYTVRSFDVEEAKEIIKTNPKLLSLNEMYLLAQSYPVESKEYKEVFDIASRLYPNDPVALINGAAADLEQGSYERAIRTLAPLTDSKEALNNLAVAYYLSGDFKTSKEIFEKAVSIGSDEAKQNLSEISTHN